MRETSVARHPPVTSRIRESALEDSSAKRVEPQYNAVVPFATPVDSFTTPMEPSANGTEPLLERTKPSAEREQPLAAFEDLERDADLALGDRPSAGGERAVAFIAVGDAMDTRLVRSATRVERVLQRS